MLKKIFYLCGFFLVGLRLVASPPKEQGLDPMTLLDETHQMILGDQIQYNVLENRQEPIILFVDEHGEIDVPIIGKQVVLGKTVKGLAYEIKKKLEKDYYYKATVVISVYRDPHIRGQVFVLGQVERQGPIEIPRDRVLTVSQAILSAGGFTRFADPTHVTLIRKDPKKPKAETKKEINVAEILEKGLLEKDLVVQGGDLLFVTKKEGGSGIVTITGAVQRPGVYPISFDAEMTVSQAILQAGGFTDFADRSDVTLVRYTGDKERKEQRVNVGRVLDKGDRESDVIVHPDDMIIVDENWINF